MASNHYWRVFEEPQQVAESKQREDNARDA
jgi:hypothetical protein